jgi:hypothetical protein
MTKERGHEWYHSNRFLATLMLKIAKTVSAFRAKKGGVCFEVAYDTKNLELRVSITLLLKRLRELRGLNGTKLTNGWGFPCPAFS